MANSLNTNPIRIDSSVVSWRNSQTLNVGTIPGYTSPRQWGIHVTEIAWVNPGASASFTITDPNDNTILWQGHTDAAFAGSDPFWPFAEPLTWRDFSVTISAGTLMIRYRA